MSTDQVQIYAVGNPYQAELIRQMLMDHNIQAFIVNKQDSSYKFGDIELYVHRDDIMRARKLIEEFENQ
ncbi:MAG: DUF2007 domain-containing protein [Bacteroidota bacterium]